MSTSSQLLASNRTRASQFLRPRGKPAFHKRIDDNEGYVGTPQALEAWYEDRQVLGKSQSEDSNPDDRRAELRAISVAENPLVFPFLTTSKLVPAESQPEDDQRPQAREKTNSSGKFVKQAHTLRQQASTAALEQELFYLAHNDPKPFAIHKILKILVHDRKLEPTSRYYEALILANIWPEYGSVSNVENILMEMEIEKIEIGANVIAAVLKVLAVHPSVELSYMMLSMVERRWLQQPPEASHYLILAMIRTGQTELAAWVLDERQRSEKSKRRHNREILPDYLVVLLITKMVENGHWEDILRYMYKLRDQRAADREIPTQFWGWLLDHASKTAREVAELSSRSRDPNIPIEERDEQEDTTSGRPASDLNDSKENTAQSDPPLSLSPYHEVQIALSNPAYHLTTHIWKYYVTSMSVRPDPTTLLNILHLASILGVPWLAHSVVAVMIYIDGIDERDGRPVAKLDPGAHALVAKAVAKEKEIFREQGRDLDKETEENERAEMETKRVRDEDEAWWTTFLTELKKDEESRSKAESTASGDVKGLGRCETRGDNDGDSDRHKHRDSGPSSTLSAYVTSDTTNTPSSAPSAFKSIPVSMSGDLTEELDITADEKFPPALTPREQPEEVHVRINEAKVPPGNLWPLFPSIGGLGSAYIDPWDALGPRSSAKGKWTKAQERFKKSEKDGRKRY